MIFLKKNLHLNTKSAKSELDVIMGVFTPLLILTMEGASDVNMRALALDKNGVKLQLETIQLNRFNCVTFYRH